MVAALAAQDMTTSRLSAAETFCSGCDLHRNKRDLRR